jgi:hypothetical protein
MGASLERCAGSEPWAAFVGFGKREAEMATRKFATIDGNEAGANVAYRLNPAQCRSFSSMPSAVWTRTQARDQKETDETKAFV